MNHQIKKEPIYDYDAVNKAYVDKLIKELKEKIAELEKQMNGG